MIESKNPTHQETKFLTHLENIVGVCQENQADIVIVGGIALRASMNQPVEHHRSNGTINDIDMIGLGPNSDVLKKTEQAIIRYKDLHNDCPPASIEPVVFSDFPNNNRRCRDCYSGIRRDSQREYYLTFREIDQHIPGETMEIIPRQYGFVTIPTLPQETTLHRYETRMGYIKPKDKEKTDAFREYIHQNGGDGLNPQLYQSYIDFCEQINDKHPHVVKLTKIYWGIDRFLKGRISGSKNFIYNLKDFFHS